MKYRKIVIVVVLSWITLASAQSISDAKAFYAYDHSKPIKVEVKDVVISKAHNYMRVHLFYESVRGEMVPAYRYLPLKQKAPYPCIFFMHFHVSDKSLADMVAMQWLRKGFCVFAIDGLFRGERKVKGRDILDKDPRITAENMKKQIFDILRGLDYLATRPEVDRKKIGFFGISMGALTGAVAVAVSPIPQAIVLADGGADLPLFFKESKYGSVKKSLEFIQANHLSLDKLKSLLYYVDPLYYAPLIAPRPVLMLNGKKDDTVPVPSIQRLFSVLHEPKQIKWYDSDHILPITRVLSDSIKFFRKTLHAPYH